MGSEVLLIRTPLIALVVLSPWAEVGAWDQLGGLKFKSHSVITSDAVLSVNESLRASREKELAAWLKGLHERSTPRLVADLFPMCRSELSGGFYPEMHLDDGSYRTANRLQQGNTAADHPKKLSLLTADRFLYKAYCEFMSAKGDSCNNLPNQSRGMSLHFNREYTEKPGSVTLASARDTCEASVGTIRGLTRKAHEHWNAAKTAEGKTAAMREYERMYFMLGVAAHAIEDSFAPAHVQRSRSDPRAMEDLCYYYDNRVLPPATTKACAHAVGAGKEPRDSIYFDGNGPMQSFATGAAKAYLLGFAEAMLDDIAGKPPDVDAFLEAFLTDTSRDGMGYLDCSALDR